MKKVLCSDGVLAWTELHWEKGDPDDNLDAILGVSVEPVPRLARIEDFLNAIGGHKNDFVIFHMAGLRELIDAIRKNIGGPREWVFKQLEEAEHRELVLENLLGKSRQKSRIARGPRPNRVDKIRESMKAIMGKERKNGCSLDAVLHGWECNQINGLRLTYEREKNVYFVDDENSVEELRKFSYRQLRTIFAESF